MKRGEGHDWTECHYLSHAAQPIRRPRQKILADLRSTASEGHGLDQDRAGSAAMVPAAVTHYNLSCNRDLCRRADTPGGGPQREQP